MWTGGYASYPSCRAVLGTVSLKMSVLVCNRPDYACIVEGVIVDSPRYTAVKQDILMNI